MDELKIKTIVGVCPPDFPIIPDEDSVRYITRGETENFEFILEAASTFEDIKQFSFIFKQYNKILNYNLYNEDGELNPLYLFNYEQDEFDSFSPYNEMRDPQDIRAIMLRLPESETIKFQKTTRESLVPCEVVVQYEGETSIQYDDTTKIINYPPIFVSGSAYSNYIDMNKEN